MLFCWIAYFGCGWKGFYKYGLFVCPEVFLVLAPKFFLYETWYRVRDPFGWYLAEPDFTGSKTFGQK